MGTGIFRARETGVTIHDFEATDRAVMDQEEADMIALSDDEEQTPISMDELSDLHHKQLKEKTIKTGGVIPFVVLTRMSSIRTTTGEYSTPRCSMT